MSHNRLCRQEASGETAATHKLLASVRGTKRLPMPRSNSHPCINVSSYRISPTLYQRTKNLDSNTPPSCSCFRWFPSLETKKAPTVQVCRQPESQSWIGCPHQCFERWSQPHQNPGPRPATLRRHQQLQERLPQPSRAAQDTKGEASAPTQHGSVRAAGFDLEHAPRARWQSHQISSEFWELVPWNQVPRPSPKQRFQCTDRLQFLPHNLQAQQTRAAVYTRQWPKQALSGNHGGLQSWDTSTTLFQLPQRSLLAAIPNAAGRFIAWDLNQEVLDQLFARCGSPKGHRTIRNQADNQMWCCHTLPQVVL